MEYSAMANPVLDQLNQQVTNTVDVEKAAALALNGVAGRIAAAVHQAMANGATAEELAPVTDEVSNLRQSADALGAAVAANTPAAQAKKP
jgi:hypothetical protein